MTHTIQPIQAHAGKQRSRQGTPGTILEPCQGCVRYYSRTQILTFGFGRRSSMPRSTINTRLFWNAFPPSFSGPITYMPPFSWYVACVLGLGGPAPIAPVDHAL
eukprot:scaffold946_cov415-Prasinococcus_capsulatus_cf.AAC.11